MFPNAEPQIGILTHLAVWEQKEKHEINQTDFICYSSKKLKKLEKTLQTKG